METTPGMCSVAEECPAGTHSCTVRYVLLEQPPAFPCHPQSCRTTGESSVAKDKCKII